MAGTHMNASVNRMGHRNLRYLFHYLLRISFWLIILDVYLTNKYGCSFYYLIMSVFFSDFNRQTKYNDTFFYHYKTSVIKNDHRIKIYMKTRTNGLCAHVCNYRSWEETVYMGYCDRHDKCYFCSLCEIRANVHIKFL